MHFSAAMKTLQFSFALAMAGAAALVACAHEQAPVNTPPSGAPPSTAGLTSMQAGAPSPGVAEMQYAGDEATVADQLATARCDHEADCQHVGTGLAFATLGDCVSRVQVGMRAELAGFGCRGALTSSGVNDCMSTIIGESCQQSSNDLAHTPQCRSAAVCGTIQR